jgi:hypothetical protein
MARDIRIRGRLGVNVLNYIINLQSLAFVAGALGNGEFGYLTPEPRVGHIHKLIAPPLLCQLV